MGQFDSSRTRVAPVFNWLYCWDVSGRTWLPQLLNLVDASAERPLPPRLKEARWWPNEAVLPAPRDLLVWLVHNCQRPDDPGALGRGLTRTKRVALLERQEVLRREAVEALAEARTGSRAWYVLEGPSQPDAYLATDDLVVVVEGKRTESEPTAKTTWMPGRHQMLRHLDAAWETRGSRQLIGLMIVEGLGGAADVPAPWCEYRQQLKSPDVLATCMPHKSPADREAILDCFVGTTTWKAVINRLGIPEATLIPSLADGGA